MANFYLIFSKDNGYIAANSVSLVTKTGITLRGICKNNPNLKND